jgi:transcriptional regulator with XRE-family HTH domain
MRGRQGLGERIAAARERSGKNKNQLARELGTSWQHVDHWEKGRTEPSLTSMQRIAEALGVSIDFLLGPGPKNGSALERFLSELAPADLSPSESEWLRCAPIDARHAAPEDYQRLLEGLRRIAHRPQNRSGKRRKVDGAALERAMSPRTSRRA